MLKNVLIFTAGLGIGVGGAYLYFKKKFEKDLEERMSKETSELNKLYEKVNEEYMRLRHEGEYNEQSEHEEKDEAIVTKNSFRKDAAEELKKVRYDRMYASDPAESEHPSEDDDEAAPEEHYEFNEKRDRKRHAEIVTEDESNEFPDYERETWLYYQDDDLFVEEETNEPVYNADEILEGEADIWKMDRVNKDSILVMSHRLFTVYELIKIDGSMGLRKR
jgi:hypothetical protein